MARINKKNAKKLAVAYSTYNKAVSQENWDSAKVWGEMLIDAQKETGIELLQESTIVSMIR